MNHPHQGSNARAMSRVAQPKLRAFDDSMKICIENCTRCHQICLSTLQHCIETGGRHIEPAHLLLMQDCANICATSADFMLRGSSFHEATCKACSEICQACADDCARFEGDQMMQECAEACRACADSCAAMSESQNGKQSGQLQS